MSWWEIAGFVTGLASVWLYVRQDVRSWPVGMANSACWLVLFWQSRLFLDAGLQVLYLGLSVWGWYLWWRGQGPGRELPVRRAGRTEAVLLAVAGLGLTGALWWLMTRQADAMPFWDGGTTALSLVAQYLLTRKVLATWWCWMAVDVAYLGMYAAQHLYLTAALQPLFFGLCVLGLRQWRASLRAGVEAAAQAAPVVDGPVVDGPARVVEAR